MPFLRSTGRLPKRRGSLLTLLVPAALLGLLLLTRPCAADPGGVEKFIRFHRLGRAKANLETSVSRYRNPRTGQVVALVAAVHIADESYYQAIQKELDRYDLVLYELVGKPGEKKKPDPRLTFVAEMQLEMMKILKCTFQLDAIDYSRHNMRHADMSAREFQKELDRRGEALLPIPSGSLLPLLGSSLKSGLAISASLQSNDPHRTNRLRWQFGRMLADQSALFSQLGVNADKRPDNVIIGLRNQHAWEVLQRSLKEGYQRTAIFYGAAHMPDFQRRLLADGWQLEERTWLAAWRIPIPKGKPAHEPKPSHTREANL